MQSQSPSPSLSCHRPLLCSCCPFIAVHSIVVRSSTPLWSRSPPPSLSIQLLSLEAKLPYHCHVGLLIEGFKEVCSCRIRPGRNHSLPKLRRSPLSRQLILYLSISYLSSTSIGISTHPESLSKRAGHASGFARYSKAFVEWIACMSFLSAGVAQFFRPSIHTGQLKL
jgi:hypothetical protein